MYRGASVGVVVPAFNEGPFIGEVLDTIPQLVDRVYAVDDCSTDDTWGEVRSRVKPQKAVAPIADGGTEGRTTLVPIRHSTNRGRGAAVKTGYRRALRDEMDVVVVMDGDGQMDPDQLERLVEPIVGGRADYAKGNRLANEVDRQAMSGWRLFGNILLTLLTNLASGYWGMRDSQNGYTAISSQVLKRIKLSNLYDQYGFLNDLLIALNLHNARIVDVEMSAVYGDEQSGIRYGTFVPALSLLLLQGFMRRVRQKYVVETFHPVAVLYAVGAGGIGLAGLEQLMRSDGDGDIGWGPLGAVSLGLAVILDKRENDHLVAKEGRRNEG